MPVTNVISEIDTFTYDNNNRVISYRIDVLGKGGFSFQYDFSYTGTNTYPDSYLYTVSQNDLNGNPGAGQSVTCLIKYSADKKLLLDSALISTNTSLNSISRIFYYTHSNGIVVKKSDYPSNTGPSITLDSLWYNANGDYTTHTRGSLDTNSNYKIQYKSTGTYGNIHTPFYTENANIVLFIINGGLVTKHIGTISREFGYNLQGAISYTQNMAYTATTDSNGLLQTLEVTLNNNPFMSSTYAYR
jgi:hypothetical protein